MSSLLCIWKSIKKTLKTTEIKFCALDRSGVLWELVFCFKSTWKIWSGNGTWIALCVCLQLIFLLSSRLSCKMRMLALVGMTKNGGVCFDCSISVLYSVCVSKMGYFNAIKSLSLKDLWVLGETRWGFSAPSPSPSSASGVSVQGSCDWRCCSPEQGLPGLCGWSHPHQMAVRECCWGEQLLRLHSREKPSPTRSKVVGEAGGKLAALQRGRKFCSMCCPELGRRWTVPQQPGFTWMKKEECYPLLTPHTG